MIRRPLAAALAFAALTAPSLALAIPRSEVLDRAKAFAFHPWRCEAQNLTAACAPAYASVYTPGDYVGLPYDWGGYMTLFEFDQGLVNGLGAGSYPDDGVLACTIGLDCSGFVSRCWDSAHQTTSSLPQISTAIGVNELLPGDVFNEAGYHVALYSHALASGEPVVYEALGYNVHLNATDGWSHVDGYVPRRYQKIEGVSAMDLLGTPANPIVISAFPYSDSRDTTQSPSDLLDGCGAAPGKSESGREYVYQTTFAKPGKLTVSVADDAGVDIDIHLYTSLNSNDCVARDDTTLTLDVDCGTYFLVADTFKGAKEYPGVYTLTATFTPANKPCGGGPPAYAPSGGLGDPCGYPGDPDLPFCNANLGADTCLYTDQLSFCSTPCASDADCAELAGGCCGDLGDGEMYCFTKALCGSGDMPGQMGQPDAGGDPPLDGGSETTTGVGGGGVGGGGVGEITGGAAPSEGGAAPAEESNSDGCSCRVAGEQRTNEIAPLLAALLALSCRARRRLSARA